MCPLTRPLRVGIFGRLPLNVQRYAISLRRCVLVGRAVSCGNWAGVHGFGRGAGQLSPATEVHAGDEDMSE